VVAITAVAGAVASTEVVEAEADRMAAVAEATQEVDAAN